MTTTTTAAVLRAPDGPFAIEEVELEDLGPHDVLVRIVGAGFCHTDMLPRGLAALELPMILGHEGSGVVVEIGSEVDRVRAGDAVVISFASCGGCDPCTTGHPAYCASFTALNMSARDLDGSTSATDAAGAAIANRWFGQSSFAEHAVVDQRGLVVVDPDLPLERMGPLGCGIQTGAGAVLNVMDLHAGGSIVVFGVGAVGLAAVMAAVLAGASDIVAVDLHQSRLDLALELGATRAFLAGVEGLGDAIRDGSEGLDHALDTTGVAEVMRLAVSVVGVGGQVVLVGVGGDDLTVHPAELTGRHVSFVIEGDADPQTFIPTLVEHWQQGRFPFERLVTTFPLADIDEAEAAMRSGTVIKPVLLVGSH